MYGICEHRAAHYQTIPDQTVHAGSAGQHQLVKEEPVEDWPPAPATYSVPDPGMVHTSTDNRKRKGSPTAISPSKRTRADLSNCILDSPGPSVVASPVSSMSPGSLRDETFRLRKVAVVLDALPVPNLLPALISSSGTAINDTAAAWASTSSHRVPDVGAAPPDVSQRDDENLEEEYFYFCLDCERAPGRSWSCDDNCDHASHPRVPIGKRPLWRRSMLGQLQLRPKNVFQSIRIYESSGSEF